MALAGTDKDDLWDFSTPGGLEPLPLSDSESEDANESDIKLLPASKRRKLQKRLIEVPDLVILDDSSEEEQPDPDKEIIEEVKRKNRERQARSEHEIEFLDLTNIVPVKDSRHSAKYEAAQANIRRNLAKLEETKALLNARTPEVAECTELSERPESSQQPVENAADGEAAEPALEPDLDKIIVKVQGKLKDRPVKVRIGKRSHLEKLFNTFMKSAEAMNWFSVGTPVKFVFDGEVIRPTDTAEDLDIEEDCVIEAHWQDDL